MLLTGSLLMVMLLFYSMQDDQPRGDITTLSGPSHINH